MNRQNPILIHLLLLIIGCMIALAFVGCKSVTPAIPTNVSERNHDSVRTELRIDTVFRDRYHTEYMRGDTLIIHDSIDRWHNKYVYIHDSIDNSRTDTIYRQIQVEKKGSAFLRNSGIALWIIIGLILLAVIAGIFVKFAK